MTPVEDIALMTASASAHFLAMAAIEDKAGQLVRHPKPSRFQMEIFAAYEWLLANNQPVRIIAAPKARQSYGSTTICHICYHHTRRFKTHGLMMADEHDRTKKIWAMFQRFADNDDFRDYWDTKYEGNTEECRFRYVEGKVKRVATWEHETANDAKAGAAGTRQVLWFSECMRYKREGEAADTKVIGNAMNSVPNEPGTAIFLESTAEGAGGFAYAVHQGAVTLNERIAGNFGNGWVRIFCAWHECEDYKLDPARPENIAWFADGERFAKFRSREEAGKILYGWTPAQIAWRRQKIVGEESGEQMFDRDFPESVEVAFSSSGNLRFDREGVARMLQIARATRGAKVGTIQENAGKFVFTDDPDHGYVWIIEEPIPGCSYCAFGDYMEGEQATGDPDDLDAHAVGILRESYRDEHGKQWSDEVVAVIHCPGKNGCQWETHVLAHRQHLLAGLFGKCIHVPEANNCGGVVISHLKDLGANVVQRSHPDHIDPNKTVKASGFKTTTRTKEQWVSAMAKALMVEHDEPPEFICRYLPAVEQFAAFVRNPNGTCSAMPGKHDDFVAAIAIALLVRAFTRIPLPVIHQIRRPVLKAAWS